MSTKLSFQIDKLDKENYDTWKLQMRAVLTKNELWGYVDGSITRPELNDSSDFIEINEWIKNDAKAMADIILSINTSELHHIKRCETSKDAWDKLSEVYESSEPDRKVTLLKQLILAKANSLNEMVNHLNTFFTTANELRKMKTNIPDEMLSVLLLYSIPKDFENFRSEIEELDELPDPQVLKCKILEEIVSRKSKIKDDKDDDNKNLYYRQLPIRSTEYLC